MDTDASTATTDDRRPRWSRRNPYRAPIRARRTLTGPGSGKDTRHLEIAIGDDGPDYLPGDSLAVIARNDPDLVAELCAEVGADPATPVACDGGEERLDAVLARRDITRVGKPVVRHLAEASGDPEIAALLEPDGRSALTAFRDGRDLLDIVQAYPTVDWTATVLERITTPIAPRLYSIASSPAAHGDDVHLTVGVVSWESGGRQRQGLCSTYLGHRIDIGETLECFVHRARSFKLPADDASDVIMVGPGTGIAPFRSFLYERRARGASGRHWLFFGDQHRASDFLYGDELTALHTAGDLDRLDLAFSRDQEHKIYVQHRMAEQAAELWAWLQAGAHFYVCGDALRMAKDVDATLHQIAQEQGGMHVDAAAAWIAELKKSRRYQRDVYAV